MEGTAITLLNEITGILVGGIETIATGIGSGLSSLVNAIFLTSAGALSTFGTLVVVFAGISLAIGLSRLVVRWLSSLGGSNV